MLSSYNQKSTASGMVDAPETVLPGVRGGIETSATFRGSSEQLEGSEPFVASSESPNAQDSSWVQLERVVAKPARSGSLPVFPYALPPVSAGFEMDTGQLVFAGVAEVTLNGYFSSVASWNTTSVEMPYQTKWSECGTALALGGLTGANVSHGVWQHWGNVLFPVPENLAIADAPWLWAVIDWVVTQPPSSSTWSQVSRGQTDLAFVLGITAAADLDAAWSAGYALVDCVQYPMYDTSCLQSHHKTIIKLRPPVGALLTWAPLRFLLTAAWPGVALTTDSLPSCTPQTQNIGLASVSIKLFNPHAVPPVDFKLPARPRLYGPAPIGLHSISYTGVDMLVFGSVFHSAVESKSAPTEVRDFEKVVGAWRDGLLGNTYAVSSLEICQFVGGSGLVGANVVIPSTAGRGDNVDIVLKGMFIIDNSKCEIPFVLSVEVGLCNFASQSDRKCRGYETVSSPPSATSLGSTVQDWSYTFSSGGFDSFYVRLTTTGSVVDSFSAGWSASVVGAGQIRMSEGRKNFLLGGQTKNPGPPPRKEEPPLRNLHVYAHRNWLEKCFKDRDDSWKEAARKHVLGSNMSFPGLSAGLRPLAHADVLPAFVCRGQRLKPLLPASDPECIVDFRTDEELHSKPSNGAGRTTPFEPKPVRQLRKGKDIEEAKKAKAVASGAEEKVVDATQPAVWVDDAVEVDKPTLGFTRKGTPMQLLEVCRRLLERLNTEEKFLNWLYANRPDIQFVKTLVATDAKARTTYRFAAAAYCSGVPDEVVPIFVYCSRLFVQGSAEDTSFDADFVVLTLLRLMAVEGTNFSWVASCIHKGWGSLVELCSVVAFESQWLVHVFDVCVCLFQRAAALAPSRSSEPYLANAEGAVTLVGEVKERPLVADNDCEVCLNGRILTVPRGTTLSDIVRIAGFGSSVHFYFMMRDRNEFKIVPPDTKIMQSCDVRQFVRGLGGSEASMEEAATALKSKLAGDEKKAYDEKQSVLGVSSNLTSFRDVERRVWTMRGAVTALNLSGLFSKLSGYGPTTLGTNNYARDSHLVAIARVDGILSRSYLPPESLACYRRLTGDLQISPTPLRPLICSGSLAGPTDSLVWTEEGKNVVASANTISGMRAGSVLTAGYRSGDLLSIVTTLARRDGVSFSDGGTIAGCRPIAQLLRLGLMYLTAVHSSTSMSKINYWHDFSLANAVTVPMAQPLGFLQNGGVDALGERLALDTWPVTDGPANALNPGGQLRFWQDLASIPASVKNVLILPDLIADLIHSDPVSGSLYLAVYLAAFTNHPTSLYCTTIVTNNQVNSAVFTPHTSYTIVAGGETEIDVLLPVSAPNPNPRTQAEANSNLKCRPNDVAGNPVVVSYSGAVANYNLCLFINQWLPLATAREITFVGNMMSSLYTADPKMFDCAIEWASAFSVRYRQLVAPVPTVGDVPWTAPVSSINVAVDGQIPAVAGQWGAFDVTNSIKSFVFPQMSVAVASVLNTKWMTPSALSKSNCDTGWSNVDRAATLIRYGGRAVATVFQALCVLFGLPSSVYPDLIASVPSYALLLAQCFPQMACMPPTAGILRWLSQGALGGCTLDSYQMALFEYATRMQGKQYTRVINNNVAITDASPSWLVKPFDWHSGLFPFLKQLSAPNTMPTLKGTDNAGPDNLADMAGVVLPRWAYGLSKEIEVAYQSNSLVDTTQASRFVARLTIAIAPMALSQWSPTSAGSLNLHTILGNQANLANYRVGLQDVPVGDASMIALYETGFAEDVIPILVVSTTATYPGALLPVKVAQLAVNNAAVSTIMTGRAPYTNDLLFMPSDNVGAVLNVSANQKDAASFLATVGSAAE